MKKDFDNNTITRKGYFDGFYQEKDFVVTEIQDIKAVIVNGNEILTVQIQDLKK